MSAARALRLAKASTASLASGGGALPRLDFQSRSFGPFPPIIPFPIDDGRGGQPPEPRLTEYLPGFNLPQAPGTGKMVPFAVMRMLADMVLPVRRALEIRKQEVSTQSWDIVLRPEYQKTGKVDELEPMRQQLIRFFSVPDPQNGLTFADWIRMAEEEVSVLDALAIYLRPTLGPQAGLLKKGLASLELIDGATIKPVINTRGGRPQPPNVAYQQYLYGAPRLDLMAPDMDLDDESDPDDKANRVVGRFSSSELIYRPFNRRTFTPYGYSNVEAALVWIKLWIDREKYHQAYFDKGDIPGMLIPAPSDWKIQQILDFEDQLNRTMAGDTQWKHRLKIVPSAGRGQLAMQIKPPLYELAFDDHTIRMLAMAMDVPAEELGVQPKGGLGGRGWAEESGQRMIRLGVQPRLTFYAEIFNLIIHWRLQISEFDFRWLDPGQEDPLKQAQVDIIYLNSGTRTRNEVREENGWDRLTEPEADMPMITTGTGVVPLKGSGEPPEQKPPTPEAPPPDSTGKQPLPFPGRGQQQPPEGEQKQPEKPDDGKQPAQDEQKAAQLDELRQWQRFVARRGTDVRPFVGKSLVPELRGAVAAQLDAVPAGMLPSAWRQRVFEWAREVVKGKGDPSALISWYNDGADGGIDWGSAGDFDACVAIAGKHVDDPEGFCALRHRDATGAWPGHASGEKSPAAALPPPVGGEPKQTKAAVHYGIGNAREHCGICVHFQGPDGCQKVAGAIDRDGWCTEFEPPMDVVFLRDKAALPTDIPGAGAHALPSELVQQQRLLRRRKGQHVTGMPKTAAPTEQADDVQDIIAEAGDRLSSLADDLLENRISRENFITRVKAELSRTMRRGAVAGGLDDAGAADLADRLLAERNEYLDDFADELDDGDASDAGRSHNRAALWAGLGWAAYQAAGVLTAGDGASFDWVLEPGADHCGDCEDNADGGPYTRDTLPGTPGDGSTSCRSNCRCRLESV